jgi:hypothetical protein
MAKETPRQRKTVDRVMHEYEHGELKSGPAGGGGKVKSRKQAIAIALSEAGASNRTTPKKNARNLRHTETKEARGQTAMQEKEGKGAKTKTDLMTQARHRDIPGRSTMSKSELERALRRH